MFAKGLYKCRLSNMFQNPSVMCKNRLYSTDKITDCPLHDDREINICPLNLLCPEKCQCNDYIKIFCDVKLEITKDFVNKTWLIFQIHNIKLDKKLKDHWKKLNVITTSLEIFNTNLEEINSISGFKNLVLLNLTKNSIKYLNYELLGKFKKLQKFILSKNLQIFYITKTYAIFYKNLISLQLTYLNFTKLDNEIFKNLNNLKILNFTSSIIMNFDQNIFQYLQNLEILIIKNVKFIENEFNEIQINNLRSLKILISTHINFCCFTQHLSMEKCESIRLKDTSSCNNFINSKFLKCLFFHSILLNFIFYCKIYI